MELPLGNMQPARLPLGPPAPDPLSPLSIRPPVCCSAHNLCYSTLVHRSDVARLSPEAYARAPTGKSGGLSRGRPIEGRGGVGRLLLL